MDPCPVSDVADHRMSGEAARAAELCGQARQSGNGEDIRLCAAPGLSR